MNKQNKTKLQFILGGILFLTVAFAACNSGDAAKETPVDTTKQEMPAPAPAANDSMEVTPGNVAPVTDGKP